MTKFRSPSLRHRQRLSIILQNPLSSPQRTSETALDPATEAARCRLVERMAKGDQAALGELYDQVIGRVFALALRIVRDRSLAEEVAEDTLFQVWRQADRYVADRGKVLTWILTICHSRALDVLRRANDTVALDESLEHAREDSLASDDWVTTQALFEQSGRVQRALLELEARERQAIALAFFRGWTHQEIAQAWQVPLGTVKTIMHRAFEHLRVSLAPES